ncbi:MarR family transcriptional regulator [Eubacteriales bacterium OttesenSCG-928-M02]|nr:MarR family transcriptional regulator [Eubacteriales bacterium OttesenSCG-928-M02]
MKNLANQIAMIGRIHYSYAQEQLKDTGLNGVDHGIIRVLSRHPGIRQEELCAHFNKDKSTVAKAMARLEERDFIRRAVNEKNKREKLVFLTKKGEEQLDRIHNMEDGWQTLLLEGFSPEEAESFRQLCSRATENAVLYDRTIHPHRGAWQEKKQEDKGI